MPKLRQVALKRIVLLFFLIGTATLDAAVGIVSRRPENHRVVRTLDQELAALFPFPGKGRPSRDLRIVFDRDAPKKITRVETHRAIELVIRDDDNWMRDSDVMEQLSGALFAHRAGSEKNLRLPRFLLAAMRGELRGIANSRKINRSNHQMIFLRALLGAGRNIDYSCSAGSGNFQPVEIYQEEAAEVLLYAIRRRNLLNGVGDDILHQESVTEKLLLKLDEVARAEGFASADELLYDAANQRAWHLFSPRPAALSRRTFARLCQREIEELDSFGKPTGRRVPVDLEVWCNLSLTRPDVEEMHQCFRRDLRDFRRGETPEARAVIDQLAALKLHPGDLEKIAAAKTALAEIWAKREKAETFLAETEVRSGGLGACAPARIDTIRHRTELLSPRGKDFLDRVEKLYSGE